MSLTPKTVKAHRSIALIVGAHTKPAVLINLKHPQLTELSPGLLQLLDLILQEEHGHCECQQRQKLKLGRHHDSEQPHQIIQRAMVGQSMSCGGDAETHAHTRTR